MKVLKRSKSFRQYILKITSLRQLRGVSFKKKWLEIKENVILKVGYHLLLKSME